MEVKTAELRKRCDVLDQDLRLVRQEKDQAHASSMQHTNNCRAELRSDIEQRFLEGSEALSKKCAEMLQSQDAATRKSQQYADDLGASITAHQEELRATLDARYK